MEGEVLLYEFFHPGTYQGDFFRSDVGAVGLLHMAEIAVGDGVLDVELAARQHVAGGLVE